MADAQHGLDLSSDENSRKSRKGAIPRNVDTYLKSAMLDAFQVELAKLSEEDVSTSTKAKHLGQMALLGSATAPLLNAAGHFVRGAVDTEGPLSKRLLEGGIGAVQNLSAGDVARKVFTGGVGGTGIGLAQDALSRHQQREIAQATKQAEGLFGGGGAGGAPSGPKVSTPSAPTLGVLRGSSNKGQRVGNTPIVAKSGVTRSISSQPVNPRTNLGDAMRPKV